MTKPAFSNLTPLVPSNQETPLLLKGSNGQRVAIKMAIAAAMQKSFVLRRCPSSCELIIDRCACASEFGDSTCLKNQFGVYRKGFEEPLSWRSRFWLEKPPVRTEPGCQTCKCGTRI